MKYVVTVVAAHTHTHSLPAGLPVPSKVLLLQTIVYCTVVAATTVTD